MDDPHDPITLRLTYEAAAPDLLEGWAARLSAAGVTIHHASPRGLDVEGQRATLEQVLHITISGTDATPRIIPDTRAQKEDDLAAPLIYAPRKPTFF